MSDELKKKIGAYVITALTGAMMAYITMSNHGIFEATTAKEIIFIISSALCIPGVVLIMVGLLVWVSKDGFFDGISYSCTYAFKLLVPGTEKKMPKYGDYVEKNREKRKEKKKGFGFLFIVGGVYFVISVILLIVFYMI